jgi:hypothetical protein
MKVVPSEAIGEGLADGDDMARVDLEDGEDDALVLELIDAACKAGACSMMARQDIRSADVWNETADKCSARVGALVQEIWDRSGLAPRPCPYCGDGPEHG